MAIVDVNSRVSQILSGEERWNGGNICAVGPQVGVQKSLTMGELNSYGRGQGEKDFAGGVKC